MRLRDLYHQPTVEKQLSRSLLSGQVSHAYLFTGPPGLGKKTAALAWAQALNCLEATGGDACDACPACIKIRNGNHPDVVRVEPEGGSLRLEQIRGICRRVVYRPYEGRYLVIILYGAEKLTAEAGNALLKMLEEPAAGTVFILVSDRPAEILPTVRSRCQIVGFRPLTRSQVAAYFRERGVPEERAIWLATLARGDLARAQALLDGADEAVRQRQVLLELWSRTWGGDRLELLGRAKDLAAQDGPMVIQTFLDWLRDIWVWQATGRSDLLRNPDLVSRWRGSVPQTELAVLRRSLTEALRSLEQNAQKQLLWEVLLLRWPRVEAVEGRN